MPHPDTQIDSSYTYPEVERHGYVMSDADKVPGYISGFRTRFEDTGHRNKQSALGRFVIGGTREDLRGGDGFDPFED